MQPQSPLNPTELNPLSGAAAIHASSEMSVAAAWRDCLGVAASILCAVHCAAMPFVVGFLPVVGLSFFADPAFHQWMVAVCLGLALLAFIPGWRLHGRHSPALIAVGRLSLIAIGAFAMDDSCCPETNSAEEASPVAVTALALDPIKPATCASACSGCSSKATAQEVASSFNQEVERSEVSEGSQETEMSVAAIEENTATAELSQVTLLSVAWPWLTPLGGVLLVVAHLRNRYWSCQSDCANGCRSDSSQPLPIPG